MFPAVGSCYSFRIVAHELAHALGVYHDHREPNLMSGSTGYLSRLSECAARFLDKHPIFNARHAKFNIPPTIQRLPPIALTSADIPYPFRCNTPSSTPSSPIVCRGITFGPAPRNETARMPALKQQNLLRSNSLLRNSPRRLPIPYPFKLLIQTGIHHGCGIQTLSTASCSWNF